jgi:hypothetical protein
MPKPPMTLKDVQAMKTAQREYDDAVEALTAAFRQDKSKAEITKAIEALEEKKKASLAFNEKFFQNYPQ